MNIETLRAWYHAELGIADNGYALPVPAAEALLQKIQAVNAEVIVDAGAGFSTLLLRCLIKEAKVYTLDHDVAWLDRVSRLLQKQRLAADHLMDLDPCSVVSLPLSDVILIDHGPTMEDRLRYLPRFARRLRPGGVLVLDDWRKSYRQKAANALTRSGFSYEVVEGTRLCFAIRSVAT